MRLGQLRDRVSILTPSTSSDTQGGRAVSWVDLVTGNATNLTRFYASVIPTGGAEQLQTAAIRSQVGYTVTMNYRATVTPSMRVQWTPYRSSTAKTLEIHRVSVTEDGGRQWLILTCDEVL